MEQIHTEEAEKQLLYGCYANVIILHNKPKQRFNNNV